MPDPTEAADLEAKSVPKTPSGIPGFDQISRGGLPRGRSTLVGGNTGAGKTIFALQFLHLGAELYDEPGVFVTFEEPAKAIRRNARSFGWDLAAAEAADKLAIVDASPGAGQIGLQAGAYDLSGLLVRIESAVSRLGARRVSIDSIGSLFSQFSDAGLVRQELFQVASCLRDLGVTCLITTEQLMDGRGIGRFGVEEFVADNVVVVRNELCGDKRRRTLEILKFRGAPHQNGEIPFTITSRGIDIVPVSAIDRQERSPTERISLGCAELDRMCGGGVHRDAIVLTSGATGVGKTLLVSTFAYEGARSNERSMIFSFEESREQLLRNAAGWSKDLRGAEARGLVRLHCSYPESLSPAEHLQRIKQEVREYAPGRVAVDSLSALERVGDLKTFREFVISLSSFLKASGIAVMFTATPATLLGGGSVSEAHVSTISDAIFLMRYVELFGEMRRGLAVLKLRGSVHDRRIREYLVDENGLQIGAPFSNVSGILAGAPTQLLQHESEKLAGMFEE